MDVDWLNLGIGNLALVILVAGLLMMFTSLWTGQGKKTK